MRVREPSTAVAAEKAGQGRHLAVAEHVIEQLPVDAVEVDEQDARPLRRALAGRVGALPKLADAALADELRRLENRAAGGTGHDHRQDGRNEQKVRRRRAASGRHAS